MDGFLLYPFSAHFSFHSNSLSSFFLHIIVTTLPTSVSEETFLFDLLVEKLDECFWYAVPCQQGREGQRAIAAYGRGPIIYSDLYHYLSLKKKIDDNIINM